MRASLVLETTEDLTEPSSPLLQIQIHRFCAFRGRESGFDPHHLHFVPPSYFHPLFSKPALIIPRIEPDTNRLSSLGGNRIPRNRLSRAQSVDVDVSLFQGGDKMSGQIVNEFYWSLDNRAQPEVFQLNRHEDRAFSLVALQSKI